MKIIRRVMENPTLVRAAVFWGAFTTIWISSYGSFLQAFLIAVILYAVSGGWRFLKTALTTAPRDLRALRSFIRMKLFIHNFRKKNLTVGLLFQEVARKHPNKVCFICEDKSWTFQEVEEYSNRIANCFAELGFRPGDDVVLFMMSRPEYVCIWLGLSKIGVIAALVNYNLRLEPLVHCISVVNCKAIIFGSELLDAVKDVAPSMKEKNLQYFCQGSFDQSSFPAKSLDLLCQESSPHLNSNSHRGNCHDKLFYIYTSGTTGLPKAAIIRHSRYVWMGGALHYMRNIRDDDIVYSSLPLYHTAGTIIAVSQAIIFGLTLAMRPKFSASKFWDDCVKYNCTIANYIGETCRYLLAQPERAVEKQHRVRLMFGNGLRPQIWEQFANRFGIKEIGEFYGSTEGNANVINTDNKVGSVGFTSVVIPSVYPISLIKIDGLTGKPARNSKGLCVVCKPGEPGELVGKIINSDPLRSFDGYVNSSANDKKIVRNVFKHGDAAFLTGDLMVMDEKGYLYFMDRTGDTFRWRGENVSTSEVEGIISKIVGNKDCAVYGVEIPGTEGRAGMVAICDPHKETKLDVLLSEMRKDLPSYAIPIFVRLCAELEVTGTFKLKKTALRDQGFNISVVKDPLYYLDNKANSYMPIDKNAYNDICEGRMRL